MAFLQKWPAVSNRRILFVTGAVIFAGMVLCVAAYTYLMSPGVQKRVLASIREPLAKVGMRMDVDLMEVDVFAGIHLRKMRLQVDRAPLVRADISIEHVKLSYSFWGLLRQRLQLKEAMTEGVQGSLVLELPETTEKKQTQPLDFQQVLELLRHPSFEVLVPKISLKDTALDVDLTQGPRHTRLKIAQADATGSIKMLPGTLEIQSQAITAGSLSMVDLGSEPERRPMSFSVSRLSLTSDLMVVAQTGRDSIDWVLKHGPSFVTLEGIKAKSSGSEGSAISASVGVLRLSPDLSLKKTGKINSDSTFMDLLSGLDIGGRPRLQITGVRVALDAPAANTQVALQQLSFAHDMSGVLSPEIRDGRHQWDIKNKLELQKLQINRSTVSSASGPETVLELPRLGWVITSLARDGVGTLSATSSIEDLKLSSLKSRLTTAKSAQISFNLPVSSWQGQSMVSLNGTKILSWSGAGADDAGITNFKQLFELTPGPSLGSALEQLKPLESLGWPDGRVEISGLIRHPMPWSEWTIQRWPELGGSMSIRAQSRPTVSLSSAAPVSFKHANLAANVDLNARVAGESSNKIIAKLDAKIEGVRHGSLRDESRLSYMLDGKAQVGETVNAEAHDSLSLNAEKILASAFHLKDQPGTAILDHEVVSDLSARLSQSFALKKPMPDVGVIRLRGQHQIRLDHGRANISALIANGAKKRRIKGAFSDSIDQIAEPAKSLALRITKPFVLTTNAEMSGNALSANAKWNSGDLVVKRAAARGLKGNFELDVSNIQTLSTAAFNVNMNIGSVDVNGAQNDQDKVIGSIKDLFASMKARVIDGKKLVIDKIESGLDSDLMKFSGHGEFLLGGAGQLNAVLTSKPNEVGGLVQGSGQLSVPMKFVLYDKRRVSFEAEPKFDGFSLVAGDVALRGVDGTMRVLEELSVDKDGKVSFLYLKNQTPFVRVDYEGVEPFVENRPLLKVDEISWRHIKIGPLLQSFEINQNLVLLNDAKLDLLNGNAVGRFYVDLHPSRFRLGFLGRFSGLQPEVLKSPERRAPQSTWAEFGGRAAVNFDIRKRLAAGRIDLTSIGKRQLLSMLDALDPQAKDEQIALVRQGLGVAYPKRVGIAMDQGMMDMEVSLGGAVTESFRVRSLPLTGFINSFAGESLQKLDSLINSQ